MSWVVTKKGAAFVRGVKTPLDIAMAHARLPGVTKELAWVVRRANRQAFAHGGHQRHGSMRWQRLAPSTIMKKGHARILIDGKRVDTFHMYRRQSIRMVSNIRGSTVYFTIQGTNSAPYSVYHQFGLGVPIRPPIVFSRKDMDMIRETFRSLIGV